MDFSANICPACSKKNEIGAMICRYCGAALNELVELDAGIRTSNLNEWDPEPQGDPAREWAVDIAVVPALGIAVYIEGQFHPSFVDARKEILLGRKAETANDTLLDLAPLGGYHLGLSRRHAIIQRTENGYEVLDLGSLNGTFLNDERLVPHQVYPLPSGSHLRVGSMRMMVLYRLSSVPDRIGKSQAGVL